jgi:hypothetical protein
MNPLLILGLVGIGGYLLLKGSSSASTGPAPTAAQLAASGLTSTSPVYGSSANPIAPPNPAAYGLDANGNPIAANGTTPGAVAAQTTSGPVFHTGMSCARTGAPLVVDGGGNPYLMG